VNITVTRKNGPDWKFTKTEEGHWEYKKRHRYRLMFGDPEVKLVWIGRILEEQNLIVTAEAGIGAKEVLFPPFGRYTFE